MIQKRWFHATTKECWKKIRTDGILLGPPSHECNRPHTFLARNLDELYRMIYLPIFTDLRKCELILSVRYVPNGIHDDYNPKCWEMITTAAIPLCDLKVLKYI